MVTPWGRQRWRAGASRRLGSKKDKPHTGEGKATRYSARTGDYLPLVNRLQLSPKPNSTPPAKRREHVPAAGRFPPPPADLKPPRSTRNQPLQPSSQVGS